MAQVKALIGNIKGPAGKDGSENQIYSTTEQVIGTWIDGKPIYRKVVILSTAPDINMHGLTLSHGISNIDRAISCRAIRTESNGKGTADVYWFNGENSTSGVFYSSEGIPAKMLIFEYTKTTDTATT